MENLEELRQTVSDILEERLSEVYYIPWAPLGQYLHFIQAVTVVFDTGVFLEEPNDLPSALPQMSLGSIYYHFVEARRRTEDGVDDFSAWISSFEEPNINLLNALAGLDFYFLSLSELKKSLITVVAEALPEKVK